MSIDTGNPLLRPITWIDFKAALVGRFQPIAASRTARANLVVLDKDIGPSLITTTYSIV